ncbi:MAG: energy-coupling factor ABC transporter ATP-binding protein [Candidatus Rifleibacteriota bacterium]
MIENKINIIIDKFSYSGDQQPVIKDLQFTIEPAKVNHVYGISGSGKSTLLSILKGDLPSESGEEVLIGNTELLNSFNRVRSIQDPQLQLAAATVIDELLLGPEYHEKSVEDALDKAFASAKSFDLIEQLTKDTSSLSFGQARILSLAAIWQYSPELLLLDEPFVGLDNRHFLMVRDAINQIVKTGTTIVLTDTRKISGENAIRIISQFQQIDGEFPEISIEQNKNRLVAEKLNWPSWEGKEPVSFALEPGELMLLTGANGAGKTQLMQRLAGIGSFSQGSVKQDIADHRFSFVPQSPDLEIFASNPIEEALTGSSASAEEAISILKFFGLGEFLEKSPLLLSFGQKKRVSICSAFMRKPSCLLLDEPLSGLDSLNRQKILTCLEFFLNNGGIAIVATHEPEFFEKLKRAHLHLKPFECIKGYEFTRI